MLHTIAFSQSVSATTTVLTALNGVTDPTVTVKGAYIYLPSLSQIAGIYAIGAGMTGAQLQAPSLRSFINLDIAPLDNNALPSNPIVFDYRAESPIQLQPQEGLSALTTTAVPGSARQNSVIVTLSDGAVAPVSGQIYTIKFTATGVTGDYAWNNVPITLSQTLPVGKYTCVGGRLEGAGLIAFRFYPVGAAFRPGFIGMQTSYDIDIPQQRFGGRGALFDFDELTPPTVDIFGASLNGVALTGYIDLVKTA